MSTHHIAPTTSQGNTVHSSSNSTDRAKLAELAAEFESMLLMNVIREMRSSARWDHGSGFEMPGADAFDRTFDVELSRYLVRSGGFGLSERLLSMFDALARAVEAAPAAAGDTRAPVAGDDRGAAAVGTASSTTTARTGWKGLVLDAPAYGGSGAQWAGFNTDRALAGADDSSVKDAFFRWTYGLSFNPAGKSKEQIGEFLRSNIQSAREYGLNILDVKGETILIETAERGLEWVDVVAAAGSSNPAETKWQWLCQADEGVPVGGGALGTALADLRSAPGGEERARTLLTTSSLTGDALVESLRAEAAAARSGRTTVASTSAGTTAHVSAGDLRPSGAVVTSRYGWRQDPFSGVQAFHRGVDLRAAEGDRVTSTGSGRVIFAGEDGGYGLSVVVEHANGLSTRYAHLSELLVSIGDDVEEGHVLGLAGRTGRATAPHLHYEVMVDGRSVDPFQGEYR